MEFIIFALLLFLVIIFTVLIAAKNIIKAIFSGLGFGRKPKMENKQNNRTYTSYEKRPKVFGPNEGEYVDFEEVKDRD